MNIKSERLTELFALYVSEQLSDLEQLELWGYADDPLYTEQMDTLLAEAFLNQTADHSLSRSQTDVILLKVFKHPEQQTAPKAKLKWPRLAIAAAAAAVIISAGIWFLGLNRNEKAYLSAAELISPGGQGATLTLADGKKVRLTAAKNGKLAEEAGVTISKTSDGQLQYVISAGQRSSATAKTTAYNTLSTAKGETYQVKLPDGSIVYLNAASSISYQPSLATAAVRRVELHGEAYFEISKIFRPSAKETAVRRSVPFVVTTDGQQVEVLGTHFNINSYADEKQVKTTLLEGAVRVTSSSDAAITAVLKPDQQAVLSADHRVFVRTVNAQDAIAWKNGIFHFEDASVEEVLRQLARWYDLDIEYTGKMPDRLFTGDIYRNLSFGEALKIIDFAKVHFVIKGRKITVSP